MYVSTLPVEEELIVMEAVRVTKVQYLQKGEVSSDMASLCHISNARNTRSWTKMITIITIFMYNELCHISSQMAKYCKLIFDDVWTFCQVEARFNLVMSGRKAQFAQTGSFNGNVGLNWHRWWGGGCWMESHSLWLLLSGNPLLRPTVSLILRQYRVSEGMWG